MLYDKILFVKILLEIRMYKVTIGNESFFRNIRFCKNEALKTIVEKSIEECNKCDPKFEILEITQIRGTIEIIGKETWTKFLTY